jgi:TPR repeat protein
MMGLSKWYLCGGEGFAPNEEKAYIYAERAAKKGLPQAEFAMGNL